MNGEGVNGRSVEWMLNTPLSASIYRTMDVQPREMAVGPGLLSVGGCGAQEPLAHADLL